MKLKNISEFKFNNAQYDLIDNFGTKILLKVDYKNKKFNIESERPLDKSAEKELEETASDLLERKHNKNFAETY